MQVEVAVPCNNSLGESAFWHPELQRLFWLNIPPPSSLHILDPLEGSVESRQMPQMITSIRPWADGLIIAAHGGVYQYELQISGWKRVVDPEPDKPFNRCNDGGTDAFGRYWFGTMQNNISPSATDIELVERSGSLFRLDPDMSYVEAERDIMVSNTICFSPGNETMYFCDTEEGVIRAYDFDLAAGEISNRRDFARFDRGHPDGSCVDSEGGLWNARWDGSCVVRFSPDGSVDEVVEVPAARVTSVAFGGPELKHLYITTARWGLDEPGQDGHLFVVETDVSGLPCVPFAAPWQD